MSINLFGIGGQPVPANYNRLIEKARKGRQNYRPHIALIAHAADDPVEAGEITASDLRPQAEITIMLPGSHKSLPEKIDAVYARGGDQSRMVRLLEADGLIEPIRRAVHSGILFAGNSAGTAGMSERMIADGMANDALIACRRLTYAKGLGLIPKIIMDTHVDMRHRHPRLVAISAENPGFVVVGVDEGTAVEVTYATNKRDLVLTVSGTNQVFVVLQNERFQSDILTKCTRGEVGSNIAGIELLVLSKGSKLLIPTSLKPSEFKLELQKG